MIIENNAIWNEYNVIRGMLESYLREHMGVTLPVEDMGEFVFDIRASFGMDDAIIRTMAWFVDCEVAPDNYEAYMAQSEILRTDRMIANLDYEFTLYKDKKLDLPPMIELALEDTDLEKYKRKNKDLTIEAEAAELLSQIEGSPEDIEAILQTALRNVEDRYALQANSSNNSLCTP